MTHDTLRTLVREDGAETEPAFTLSAHDVLRGGRRALRRRRAVTGLAGLATAAVVAAVVAVPALSHDDSSPRLDAASRAALQEYDATLMPALIDETVRQATQGTAPPFAHGTVVAEDDQGHRLAQRDLRRTSMWVGLLRLGQRPPAAGRPAAQRLGVRGRPGRLLPLGAGGGLLGVVHGRARRPGPAGDHVGDHGPAVRRPQRLTGAHLDGRAASRSAATRTGCGSSGRSRCAAAGST